MGPKGAEGRPTAQHCLAPAAGCSGAPPCRGLLRCPTLPQRRLLLPNHVMTRWALLVLMVLTSGRALLVSGTPSPAFQLLPQNPPQATPCPVTSESTTATTTGPSTAWGHPSPGPRSGPRIILSLDVPIGLLQILLEQARARASREQATTNARILAQVGRR